MTPSPELPPSGEELLQRVRELERALAGSPVTPLDRALQELGRSLAVFIGNAAELRVTLDEGQQVPRCLEIADMDHPERLELFLDELDRLLHNYLAATFTLREHTMKLKTAHFTDDLRTAYAERVTAISSLGDFIKQLREVTQHDVLPIIQQKIEGSPDHFDSAFILHAQTLRQRHSWSGSAKQYLAGLGDEPRLDAIVDDYTRAVEQFTAWVFRPVVIANGQAFAELQVLRQQMMDLFRPPP